MSICKNESYVTEMNLSHFSTKYRALVIDSGAIIKLSGFRTLHNSACTFYTVPDVLKEIRDSKARHHLVNLPFKLQIRKESCEGVAHIISFSKMTGDYASLSVVDIKVLGLLYDLEKEGCQNMAHIRLEPNRKMTFLKNDPLVWSSENYKTIHGIKHKSRASSHEKYNAGNQIKSVSKLESNSNDSDMKSKFISKSSMISSGKTWAMILNSYGKSNAHPTNNNNISTDFAYSTVNTKLASVNISYKPRNVCNDILFNKGIANKLIFFGQFSDSEGKDSKSDNFSLNDIEVCKNYNTIWKKIEESKDSFIKISGMNTKNVGENLVYTSSVMKEDNDIEFIQFPSLKSFSYSDCEKKCIKYYLNLAEKGGKRYKEVEITSKKDAMKSFIKYKQISFPSTRDNNFNSLQVGNITKKTENLKLVNIKKTKNNRQENNAKYVSENDIPIPANKVTISESHIIGGVGDTGQCMEVIDDGKGWISCLQEVEHMRAMRKLIPGKEVKNITKSYEKIIQSIQKPQKENRTACATTDFSMQNVILQMNLELLTVDGTKIRKLKSWISRCQACFKIYTGSEDNRERLFCSRCGSSVLSRIAASVDSRRGSLQLHLSKNYKHVYRGTKFKLPKPGKGNKFQGGLLLREDQLLYGAWNKKMMKSIGRKEAVSLFGYDIASSVSCDKTLKKRHDVFVGFGNKNPNATKHGRERRGKKKKK